MMQLEKSRAKTLFRQNIKCFKIKPVRLKKGYLLAVAASLFVFLVVIPGFRPRGLPARPMISRPDGDTGSPPSTSCLSNPRPVFTANITDLSKTKMIVPPGGVFKNMDGTEVIKTHSFLVADGRVPVYAPTDSKLFMGVKVVEEGYEQYSLFFEVSCEVYYITDHIFEPVPKLAEPFSGPLAKDTSDMKPLSKLVSVKAGELIGYTDGDKGTIHWDFGVYNRQKKNHLVGDTGYELAGRDFIADCPYDYFIPELKAKYYSIFGNFLSGQPVPRDFCKESI